MGWILPPPGVLSGEVLRAGDVADVDLGQPGPEVAPESGVGDPAVGAAQVGEEALPAPAPAGSERRLEGGVDGEVVLHGRGGGLPGIVVHVEPLALDPLPEADRARVGEGDRAHSRALLAVEEI